MSDVLWACVVYEEDAPWLPSHLESVMAQDPVPSRVVVIDTGDSRVISAVVEVVSKPWPGRIEYVSLGENLGFNPGLNRAVSVAIEAKAEWLATMTVRANPRRAWLGAAIHAGTGAGIGMVTTLHLAKRTDSSPSHDIVDPESTIDCLGHNLGPNGELFDFAERMTLAQLHSAHPCEDFPIWAPCSGGALYKAEVLRAARELIHGPLVRDWGFKSYNCDAIGYILRAAGFRNAYALDAVCDRDRSGSTSRKPKTPGLLLNQEINRIANMVEFWPSETRIKAVRRYLHADRSRSGLKPIDLRIARTLGEGLARTGLDCVAAMVRDDLEKHIGSYPVVKRARGAVGLG